MVKPEACLGRDATRVVELGLRPSPAPRPQFEGTLAEVYADGVKQAAIDTGLPELAFPAECPYSLTQLEQELVAGDLPEK